MGLLNPDSKVAPSVTLVIFEGGLIRSPLEKQMQMVRQGMVLDLVERARDGGLHDIVVVTSYPGLASRLQSTAVEVVLDREIGAPFHFGRRLQDVVQDYRLEKVLYMGGASAPLISSAEIQYLTEILAQNEGVLLANNYYSADIVGFAPGQALNSIASLPPIDNTLALALSNEGGLRWVPVQRTLGLNFDVDTPTDIMIMSVHPAIGPHTYGAVQELNWDFHRYDAIKDLLSDPNGEMVIYGRVGSNLFQYLDANTRCRLRLYSEERGMKALGRDARGEVKALLGRLIENLGFENFFVFLSEIAQGAVLDTRVLFEHFGWQLTSNDRFASDLGEVDLIVHPQLKAFTRAALEAPIPVLLGGHSLVAGGLWALIDAGSKNS